MLVTGRVCGEDKECIQKERSPFILRVFRESGEFALN